MYIMSKRAAIVIKERCEKERDLSSSQVRSSRYLS